MKQRARGESAGVVCLHGGILTPMPERTRSYSGGAVAHRPQFFVIRCEECGREAPYLADQIVTLERVKYAAACAA